ncbi:lasso RiPP family leader peptide-containing protein [Kibdelosporangium lantanae]|uniref:Lasso RiPP family leader peptide-containing protein n=1 Tax=Kibdelosporangium lantanae TaxID=1497396 RepID=A0ABW3MIH5_9PSEU
MNETAAELADYEPPMLVRVGDFTNDTMGIGQDFLSDVLGWYD